MESNGQTREPADVAELRERIENWRKTRAKPERMAEDLWRGAVKLAGRHGINPIARALRLDYYALKGWIDGRGHRRAPRATRKAPAFVEVRPAPAAPSVCLLEIEEPKGAKMTVRLSSAAEVVAVAEAFWRCRR
jgi:hypothetical protein